MRTVASDKRAVPLICAHACTVDGGWPNTLEGLRTLVANGVEMVEIDVRRSGDGVLLAHHDDRLSDRRLVRESSARDIAAAYPEARRPASLAELLGVIPPGTRVQLDLKSDGVEAEGLELALAALPPTDVFVTTLDARQVVRVKRLAPQVSVGLSLNRSPIAFLRGVARAPRAGADLLAVHHRYLRTRLPARAAAAQLPLFVWTVDDEVQLRRLVHDPRIACVITNRPLRARALRDARG